MLFYVLFVCVMFYIPDTYGAIYTVSNATNKFTEYKKRYNKVYNNTYTERKHYLAFIDNLNTAAALNDSSPDSNTIYVINKYADLDPVKVEERYAIHLKTYDAIKEGDHQERLRSDHGIEVNDNNLYNLKNADDIFERYVQDENRNFTKKRDGFTHFYRFVKTLVEKNRGIYEGSDSPDLGHSADILVASNEFFY